MGGRTWPEITASRGAPLVLIAPLSPASDANHDGDQRDEQTYRRNSRAGQERSGREAELDLVHARLESHGSEERIGDKDPCWLSVDSGRPAAMIEIVEHQIAGRVSGGGHPHDVRTDVLDPVGRDCWPGAMRLGRC